MRSTRARQRGVAVLTAMLVVTIGTVIAVNLMWNASLDLRRTTSSLAADQGLMYLHSAEAWAGDILRQDQVESNQSDHLGEAWAIELPPLPVDGGVLSGRLEDMQGRFNLNNLVTPQGEIDELSLRQFERLLNSLGLDTTLSAVVADWIDADTEAGFPIGGEDGAYASTDPPYRTPNSVITSTSELLAMSGFDAETYRILLPYVTALPSDTALNVNTASDYLLASLSDDIDLSLGTAMVEDRAGLDFSDINATFEGLVEPDVLRRIDGVSSYFLLTATVTLGTHQLTMYSLLERDSSGIVRAIFRSLGVQ